MKMKNDNEKRKKSGGYKGNKVGNGNMKPTLVKAQQ